ncbi:hypothetical protein [Arthrobacter sp. KBS0703]|nr:hypothetical protein [Arthrobacter sp. KBS0703]
MAVAVARSQAVRHGSPSCGNAAAEFRVGSQHAGVCLLYTSRCV